MRIEFSKGEPVSNASFDLDLAEESKVLAAIAEAERAETTSAADILKQIRRS